MEKEYIIINAPQKDLFHELNDKGGLIKVLSEPGILRGASVLDLFLKNSKLQCRWSMHSYLLVIWKMSS